MGVSIIDGTVEQATAKRARGGVSVLRDVRFQLDDGSSRTLKTLFATHAVAEHLKPGDAGRFYLFTALDVKGVHGVRRADGTVAYGFPGNNTVIFIMVVVVSLVWLALKIGVDGEVPLLGVGLLILGIVGYALTSRTKRETRRQFDSDDAFVAPPPSQARTLPPDPASVVL